MTDTIVFEVPAMAVPVRTKINKRSVIKRDVFGHITTVDRILPKARARFGGRSKKGKVITYTDDKTRDFEEWIYTSFFKVYPSSCGIFLNGQIHATHSVLLGCTWFGENKPCTRFRTDHNFTGCKACVYRRKNLKLTMEAHLIDDRHIDLDNLEKIALDALNQRCFYDDGQFSEKHIRLVPYAPEEKMVIKIDVLPEAWDGTSICNAYKLKNLSTTLAEIYVRSLTQRLLTPLLYQGYPQDLGISVSQSFIAYLDRADGRSYVRKIAADIQEGKYNG